MEQVGRFGIEAILKEEAVTQLVRAEPKVAEMMLKQSGIDFRGERYFMLIFEAKYYEDMYFLVEQSGQTKEQRYKMDVSKELMKNRMARLGRLFFMRRPGSVSGVVEIGGSCTQEDIRAAVSELLESIRENTGLDVKARISSIHSGLGELSACFGELESLVRYCGIIGIDKPVAFYDEYTFSPFPNPMLLAKNAEMRLFSSARSGDYFGVAQLIEGMIKDSFFNVASSIYVVEYKFAHMKSLIISLLSDVSLNIGVDFLEDINAMRRILEVHSAQSLIDEVNSIFGQLTEFSSTTLKQFPPLWLRDVGKYIDDNFSDPMLNISAVAAHFDMCADYISREFKAYSGISILEYIHTLRLAEARRLLAGGMNVHDVAQRVGYGHERTMTRAFKKYEGITPGMLRGQAKPNK